MQIDAMAMTPTRSKKINKNGIGKVVDHSGGERIVVKI
jgi:hypothetical protein